MSSEPIRSYLIFAFLYRHQKLVTPLHTFRYLVDEVRKSMAKDRDARSPNHLSKISLM